MLQMAKTPPMESTKGHQRHEGGPTKGLPMVTHYHSHKSGPIQGYLRVLSSHRSRRHQGSGLTQGLLRVRPQLQSYPLKSHESGPIRGQLKV